LAWLRGGPHDLPEERLCFGKGVFFEQRLGAAGELQLKFQHALTLSHCINKAKHLFFSVGCGSDLRPAALDADEICKQNGVMGAVRKYHRNFFEYMGNNP
jgi:hypothetical protein